MLHNCEGCIENHHKSGIFAPPNDYDNDNEECTRRELGESSAFEAVSNNNVAKSVLFHTSVYSNNVDPLSSTFLLKSANFCSPILKEQRGSESWRDFL